MSATKAPVINLVLTPVEIDVDDCIATILEVSKLKLPWIEYQASVQVKCRVEGKEVTSQVFQVSFTDSDDLKRKLLIEVSKFKYNIFLYGVDELKKRGIIL
jgi:hypothetical protein